jgi:5-methylcytosine-specific restriction protein A
MMEMKLCPPPTNSSSRPDSFFRWPAKSSSSGSASTDNTTAPENVQLRIVGRYKGCCAGCQNKLAIGRWHLDHVIPLEDGGVNAEGNLQPLCVPCHGVKTSGEATARAKVRAKAKAHLGIKTPPKRKIVSAGFPKRVITFRKSRLAPRDIYARPLITPIGSLDRPGRGTSSGDEE